MNEDKATRYHRQARLARIASTLSGAGLLVFLLISGWSIGLREAAAWVSTRLAAPVWVPWLSVAIYVAIVAGMNELLTLPVGYFRGYVLERRYDLSRETAGGWLADHLKASAIGLAFAIVIAQLVYFCLGRWPTTWWLIAGGTMLLLTVTMTRLAPVVLLPVFYKFAPLGRGALRERLSVLADRAGTPVVGVYEWKLGEKTSKANAALAGLGATRRILVSDTLLRDYSDDEIEVVLAHELAHHVHRDLWTSVAFEGLVIFAALAIGDRVLASFAPRLGLDGIADVAGLPLLILTTGALSLVLMPVVNAVSRLHERRADRFALDLTRNAPAFVSAMRKLGAQNLAEERPSRLVEIVFHTHPPIARRIEAARTWAAR